MPPSPPPQENPSWELLPTRHDPILPEVIVAEEQEAKGDEPARLAEELRNRPR